MRQYKSKFGNFILLFDSIINNIVLKIYCIIIYNIINKTLFHACIKKDYGLIPSK